MSNISVSIIIPCRNEEAFIYEVLLNISQQSFGTEGLEVIIADGLSTDKTKAEIERFKSDHPLLRIQLIDNEQKVVPYALNKAIQMSSGEIIVRLDAHSVYPEDYVERLVKELEARPEAWNVGGCWDTQPGAETAVAKAIVAATSHPVGIGNAMYRLEGTETRKVDTVPFGCFRKEVFDKIGLFDEDLVRNQDDEFNLRIIENGGSIYLIPDLKIKYFARSTMSKMAKMFYQYGYYKPLVNKKRKKPATMRQFAPLLLVLGILFGWMPALFWTPFILIYAIILGVYLFSLIVVSLFMKAETTARYLIFSCFLTTHFSYGWGYIRGIIDFGIRGMEKKGKTVDISR